MNPTLRRRSAARAAGWNGAAFRAAGGCGVGAPVRRAQGELHSAVVAAWRAEVGSLETLSIRSAPVDHEQCISKATKREASRLGRYNEGNSIDAGVSIVAGHRFI